MALALRYAARSDLGLLRDGNEDSGYIGPRLLVVADGMGGHVAGEVASAVAATTLSALEMAGSDDPLADLADAIEAANEQLRQLVAGDPTLRGMGTTLTALLHDGTRLGFAHVGDSRGYLLRDGVLQQITRDHSFVQSLIDEGRITKTQAETHPQRSLITQALDGREDVEPDLSLREARLGDRYLLCSDGLSDVVREETMRDVLRDTSDLDAVCEALVDLALRAGGPDNITCIVADLVDLEDDHARPAVGAFLGAAAHSGMHAPLPPMQDQSTGQAGPNGEEDDEQQRQAGPARRVARRGAARPPRRRRRRWPVVALSLVVLAGLLGYGLYSYSQRQYYVAVDQGENVAIYRGVPSSVLGVALSSLEEPQDLPVRSLPIFSRERVQQTLEAADLEDARRIVANLRAEARLCASAPPTPAPTPDVAPSATASPSASPARSTPSGTPSRSASASPFPTSLAPSPRPVPAGCEGATP